MSNLAIYCGSQCIFANTMILESKLICKYSMSKICCFKKVIKKYDAVKMDISSFTVESIYISLFTYISFPLVKFLFHKNSVIYLQRNLDIVIHYILHLIAVNDFRLFSYASTKIQSNMKVFKTGSQYHICIYQETARQHMAKIYF